MDQAPIKQTTARGLHHGVRSGIEVGIVVVPLVKWRGIVPAEPRVQRELGRYPKVVLHVERVDVLAKIDHSGVAEVNDAGRTEDKVRQVVTGRVAGNGAARWL